MNLVILVILVLIVLLVGYSFINRSSARRSSGYTRSPQRFDNEMLSSSGTANDALLNHQSPSPTHHHQQPQHHTSGQMHHHTPPTIHHTPPPTPPPTHTPPPSMGHH